jgi:hypothetical protein
MSTKFDDVRTTDLETKEGRDDFRITTFSVTADKILAEPKTHLNAYKGLAGFVAKLPEMSPQQILEHATALFSTHEADMEQCLYEEEHG